MRYWNPAPAHGRPASAAAFASFNASPVSAEVASARAGPDRGNKLDLVRDGYRGQPAGRPPARRSLDGAGAIARRFLGVLRGSCRIGPLCKANAGMDRAADGLQVARRYRERDGRPGARGMAGLSAPARRRRRRIADGQAASSAGRLSRCGRACARTTALGSIQRKLARASALLLGMQPGSMWRRPPHRNGDLLRAEGLVSGRRRSPADCRAPVGDAAPRQRPTACVVHRLASRFRTRHGERCRPADGPPTVVSCWLA